MKTPKEILPNEKDYSSNAWKEYSIQELGNFVHLLSKRSSHRTNADKKSKDLKDARNYWRMIGAHLDDLELQ